ncbi:MAG: winged helix-turn-helix domain-containing protein [Candidatus Hadarchaeia archaeon]
MYKRDKWKIYLDILKVVSRNNVCSKTKVMHLSNLSWRTFTKHFEHLLKNNFLKKSGNAVKSYSLTERGVELHSNLVRVEKMFTED